MRFGEIIETRARYSLDIQDTRHATYRKLNTSNKFIFFPNKIGSTKQRCFS